MRVLSISNVFPNPSDPGLGLFVRSRLQRAAALAEIKVIAPVAVVDYSRKQKWIGGRSIPLHRTDGPLEVFHPRWLYPPFGGAWNAVFLYLQLLGPIRRLRKQFPFDVIDAHFAYPDGITAWMLSRTLGVPFLVTLRGNETMHAAFPLRGRFIRDAIRHAGRVVCVSESLRKFAISLGVDPARTRTIPNGIDAGIFYPRDRALCRRKHGIPDDRKVILSAGALIERKGHHRIVEALKDLESEGVDAQLLIAGSAGREGRFEERLREVVSQHKMESKVRFLGQMAPEVLPELMSAADLLCLASSREGWPNVVHEAMGCGAPIVATDVGGVADMVPSEAYGYVIPFNDRVALRDALRKALQKDWDRPQIARFAASRSWEQVAAEAVEEMQKAAAERNR